MCFCEGHFIFHVFFLFLWTLVVKVLQCRIHIYNILCIKCGCFKRKLQPTSFLSAIWVPQILSAFLSYFWINKYFNSLSISCWSNIHKLECFCESSAFECLLHHLRKIAVVLNSKCLISSCWCYDIIFSGHSRSVCVITCNSDKVMNELSVCLLLNGHFTMFHIIRRVVSGAVGRALERLQCRCCVSEWQRRPFFHSDWVCFLCSRQSLCTINNMAIRRKDSFLWGKGNPINLLLSIVVISCRCFKTKSGFDDVCVDYLCGLV